MPSRLFSKRSGKLLSLATKVATREIGLKLSQAFSDEQKNALNTKITRIKQARVITQNLSELKGAAMKAGQLLSIDSSQFLPEEATEILSRLQSMATPEKFETINRVLKSELKDDYRLLENIDEKALAAASIGQVHSAQFKKNEVVLKVQYPDILDSIDKDLHLLQSIVQSLLLPTKKSIDLTASFAELSAVLKQEADYNHELSILQDVHNKLKGDDFFLSPAPYPEVSTSKVICMHCMHGISLTEWLKSDPSKVDKEILASEMLNLFMREFLQWKFVQTDPNFANFLVQQDPLKVVLLDFGATLKFSDEFISEYLETLKITANGNVEEVFQQAVSFELLDSRETKETKIAFYDMMMVSLEPFLSDKQPFDFSDAGYEQRSRVAVLKFTKSLVYSAPPRKVLFLHRKLGGLFSLLRKLEVKIDLKPHWKTLVKGI